MNQYKYAFGLITVLFASLALADELLGTQELSRVRQGAVEFVKGLHAKADGDVSIEAGALDPRLSLPACPRPLQTALAPGSRETGNVTVSVRCTAGKPWQVFVPVKVQRYGEVFVAARPLQRGQPLKPSDFSKVRRDVAQTSGDTVSDLSQIQFKRAKHSIAPGTVITTNLLESTPIVKRGQKVMILAERKGLQVQMKGEALADAGPGETVPVRNLASRRVVDCRAVEPGIVRVLI